MYWFLSLKRFKEENFDLFFTLRTTVQQLQCTGTGNESQHIRQEQNGSKIICMTLRIFLSHIFQ
jgi:hypothetical protein